MSTNDSEELEDLFNSILLEKKSEIVPVEVVKAKPNGDKSDDSDELENLFDSISASRKTKKDAELTQDTNTQEKMINKIGYMTRDLHDSLCELGVDKKLVTVSEGIPDTLDRLKYVTVLTKKAADNVLNATDAAEPIVTKIATESSALAKKWDNIFSNKSDIESFKILVNQTRQFLNDTSIQAKRTNGYLTDIMMAQDFQDLTGQIIKKVIDITEQTEQQLLSILIENSPAKTDDESLLNGPAINPEGRTDVITSQSQVDDLLESLGF